MSQICLLYTSNRTRAKVVKNKVAPPFREAEFDIMYGEGISKYGELVDLAVKLNIIQKSGSWFSMGEERIGQGKDAAKQFLREDVYKRQDLDDPPSGHAADAQGQIQGQGAGGDALHHHLLVGPQAHDGALAIGPLNLGDGGF